jgi:hypothetical protein
MHLTQVHLTLAKLQATVQREISGIKTTPQVNLSLQTNNFAPGELLTAVLILASRVTYRG